VRVGFAAGAVVTAWAEGRKNGKETLEKYRALYAQAEAEIKH
jgi:hypothetical protein